jgi:phosphatidylserine/phosphatidylglycerophosphate/cardiolipin synthase-like enzyme
MSRHIRALLTLALVIPLFLAVSQTPASASATVSCQSGPGGYALTTLPGPGLSLIYHATASAHKSLNLVMYELSDQTELAALAAAARRGVVVKVLLDRDYSGYSVNLPAYRYLSSHRVAVAWGPYSTIVHQKTMTIDSACALIMTGNLTPQYYPTTRDYIITDTNRSEVAAINATFSSDFTGHAITPRPSYGNLLYSPGSESALVSLISSATKTVTFESEELRDSYIVNALASDAKRGVKCSIVMVASAEWNQAFMTLKSAGCQIHLYPNSSTALYIHAKAIVVDYGTPRARAFVGSQNASVASLMYNRELGLVLSVALSGPVVSGIATTMTADFNAAPQRF